MKRLIIIIFCIANPLLGQTANPETIAWGQLRTKMIKASKQEQDIKINAAIRDWQAGKPLPGLPDLKKPVRVKVGSYICNTDGELLNPNIDVLMTMHQCTITMHTMLVRVVQPTNEKDYISGYYHEIIEVISQPKDMSNGNVFTGWVPISTLGNSVKPQ